MVEVLQQMLLVVLQRISKVEQWIIVRVVKMIIMLYII